MMTREPSKAGSEYHAFTCCSTCRVSLTPLGVFAPSSNLSVKSPRKWRMTPSPLGATGASAHALRSPLPSSKSGPGAFLRSAYGRPPGGAGTLMNTLLVLLRPV